jgi:hypothetical protein
MAYGRKQKTEHSGAKHGKGFYGRKQEAKEFSNKNRRLIDRELANGNFNLNEEWDV